MRFGSSKNPGAYLGRRYQMRLVSLVLALGLVILAIQVARQPDFWAKLFPPEQPTAQKPATPPNPEQELPPGEFRIKSQPNGGRPGAGPEVAKSVEKSGEEATGTERKSPTDDEHRTVAAEIAPFVLQTVKDDTVGVRADERDAYYHVLAQAQDARPGALEAVARPGVAYAAVMAEPAHWRGRAVTIDGMLHRLQKLPVGENSYGVERLYDAWLFTADSGIDPWRVVCSGVPEGLPLAEELNPPVQVKVTGYFFKKQGYAATHGLHTAPLVLAGRIERVLPPVQFEFEERAFRAWVIAFGVALAALTAFLFWRFTQEDRRFARSGVLKRVTETPREQIEVLKDVPLYDARTALRELGEAARETANAAAPASESAPPAEPEPPSSPAPGT